VATTKQENLFISLYIYIYIYTDTHTHTWVRASWIEFNNYPTRSDLFSLLYFCRQLYIFRVLTPIIRSSYNCNYSFWYWLNAMNKTEFNNCPTRCDLFNLLYFCRQLYMFRVLTPIISSSYNCNYSFWYWWTAMNNILILVLVLVAAYFIHCS
jgi:hypothetical protein